MLLSISFFAPQDLLWVATPSCASHLHLSPCRATPPTFPLTPPTSRTLPQTLLNASPPLTPACHSHHRRTTGQISLPSCAASWRRIRRKWTRSTAQTAQRSAQCCRLVVSPGQIACAHRCPPLLQQSQHAGGAARLHYEEHGVAFPGKAQQGAWAHAARRIPRPQPASLNHGRRPPPVPPDYAGPRVIATSVV